VCDTYIDQTPGAGGNQPAITNFGAATILEVRTRQSGGLTPVGQNARAILRFDLDELPPGATITGVQLKLWKESTDPSALRSYEAYWCPNDTMALEQPVPPPDPLITVATWNNFSCGLPAVGDDPAVDPLLLSTTDAVAGTVGQLSWTSTQWTNQTASEFAGDKVMTIMIKDATESATTGNNLKAQFASKENVALAYPAEETPDEVPHKPVLVIQYELNDRCSTPGDLDLQCSYDEGKVSASWCDVAATFDPPLFPEYLGSLYFEAAPELGTCAVDAGTEEVDLDRDFGEEFAYSCGSETCEADAHLEDYVYESEPVEGILSARGLQLCPGEIRVRIRPNEGPATPGPGTEAVCGVVPVPAE
jgi:hypothetical protein